MQVHQVVHLCWLTGTKMIVAHETLHRLPISHLHWCSRQRPCLYFWVRKVTHLGVIFRMALCPPEKRGTPASIISTFTQVKNQTFSFHFFQLYRRPERGNLQSEGLRWFTCWFLCSLRYAAVCVWIKCVWRLLENMVHSGLISCCLPKLYFKVAILCSFSGS